MNVLEVVIGPYPEIRGGVDKMVSLLVAGLMRRGCEVAVLVPGSWEIARLRSREVDGVSVYERRLRLPLEQGPKLRSLLGWLGELPRTLLDLRRICRKHRIDIIHIHTATNYVYWFRLLRLIGGPPYVITFHGSDVADFRTRRKGDRALIRWALAGSAAANAVSRWLTEEAKRVFSGLCDPVCIYNGIAVTTPRREADAATNPARALIGDSPYFVMVGSFDPYKGHDIAIRAWGLLPSDRRPHLLIVGEGPLRESYLQIVDQLGCTDRIHLTGQLPNAQVQLLLASALGMVFPSRNEGFGYVILEAGLAETPLLCSRIPPLDEIVVDGETGILVPPDDPQALADAVLRLVADPELRRRLGANLRRAVETRFSTGTMADKYAALFTQAGAESRLAAQ